MAYHNLGQIPHYLCFITQLISLKCFFYIITSVGYYKSSSLVRYGLMEKSEDISSFLKDNSNCRE